MKKRLALLLTLLALTFSPLGVNPSRAAEPTSASETSSLITLADLPVAAQPAVSAAVGRGDSAYQFVPSADGYHVENSAHDLSADFSTAGMKLRSGDARWMLALQAIGYGEALETVAEAELGAVANRLDIVRGDLTEWYINGPFGLEQGFTLASRPVLKDSGALTLTFAMDGNVHPRLTADVTTLELVNDDGATAFRYAGLHAYDATGKALRAWMESPADGAFKILVDDTGAKYPLTIDPLVQQAYLKASNTGAGDNFGWSVAISGDTLVVGAVAEDSNATGVNGNQSDNSANRSGAAYVFTRSGGTWVQQAYLKASNTGAGDDFGYSVSISGDTLVVGAVSESSNATGVNGNGNNNSANRSGAAYVFTRSGGTWVQQAYLKASNTGAVDQFGYSVSISGDSLVIGASYESSNATGVNGNQNDNSALYSGAAYVFTRSGGMWVQQAYLKASNTETVDRFGYSVAISDDTLVVGAPDEDSNATGVNGDGSNNSALYSGAAYVFTRSGGTWVQQAYLKASNTGAGDWFGNSVAILGDTLVVGAADEASNTTGVNGNQNDNSANRSGAAYVFTRSGGAWVQQAYLKASNTGADDVFGYSVAISGDTLVVGALFEDSSATGVNGIQNDNSASSSGAAYVFTRSGGAWVQQAYLKASNTGAVDVFGHSVAISGDTLVVGATSEDSNATGVNGNQNDDLASVSGAVYAFYVDNTFPTITSATSTTADGTYTVGATINITLNFSESISSAAGLTIILDTGAVITTGALSNVNTWSGTYTIGVGENSADLTISSTAGTITDAASNNTVDPSVPAGQNIADSRNIVVDTIAPSLISFTRQNPLTSPTNADTLVFRASFSVDVQNVDATDFTVAGTTAAITLVTRVSASQYDITVSGGDLAGLNGTVRVDLAVGQDIADPVLNALPADEPATDETYDVNNSAPLIASTNLSAAYTSTGPSSFAVTFSEAVNNAGGGTGTDDAANPNNYVVMEQGSVSGFQTTACNNINAMQDTRVTPSGVTYIPNTAIVNFGSPLPAGTYRLFVCGTTSIVDLAGNLLNSGVDYTFDFAVNAASVVNPASPTGRDNNRSSGARWLPSTGFVPNIVTRLPEQPAELAYTKMSDLWLEIPSQNVKANIVGVPQSASGWDVKWLGNDAGWLNGTAFPSWVGNSVITAHVMGADGLPGPFAKLQNLNYGERIIVHMLDQQYIFEISNKRLVRPDSTAFAFEHLQDASYLTLVTCSGYNEESNTYSFRRIVRAVLVEVK